MAFQNLFDDFDREIDLPRDISRAMPAAGESLDRPDLDRRERWPRLGVEPGGMGASFLRDLV